MKVLGISWGFVLLGVTGDESPQIAFLFWKRNKKKKLKNIFFFEFLIFLNKILKNIMSGRHVVKYDRGLQKNRNDFKDSSK